MPQILAFTAVPQGAAVLPSMLRRCGTLSAAAATSDPVRRLSGDEQEEAAVAQLLSHCRATLTLRVSATAAPHVVRAMNLPPHLEASLPDLTATEMVTSLNRATAGTTILAPTSRELRLLELIPSLRRQGKKI